MSQGVDRRRFLMTAPFAAYACAACSSSSSSDNGQDASHPVDAGHESGPVEAGPSCGANASGPGLDYCDTPKVELRVLGGAKLSAGQVMLMALDDLNAVIVARDAKGLYALSATCTHACCTVTICTDGACGKPVSVAAACAKPTPAPLQSTGTAFLCPCHRSEYAADGQVRLGPAPRPLPSLSLRVDGDDALVDMSKPVDAAVRVS
jgi:Rieske Fe-S protein